MTLENTEYVKLLCMMAATIAGGVHASCTEGYPAPDRVTKVALEQAEMILKQFGVRPQSYADL